MALNTIVDNARQAKANGIVKFNPYKPETDEYLAFEAGWEEYVTVSTRPSGQEFGVQWDGDEFQSVVPKNLAEKGEGYLHADFGDALSYLREVMVQEMGQIGKCGDCQASALQSISNDQAATAAKLAYETAEARWTVRAAQGLGTECLIESTDIFDALIQLSLPCTEVAEGQVEDAICDLGFYTKAAEAFKTFQASA